MTTAMAVETEGVTATDATGWRDGKRHLWPLGLLVPLLPFIAGGLATLTGVGAFWWTLSHGQYDDPAGDAARILLDDAEDRPLSDDRVMSLTQQ